MATLTGKRTARRLLGTAAACVPLALLERLSEVDLVVTYYHTVTDRRVPHVAHLHGYRSLRAFEADLDLLLRRRAPLDLRELIASLDGAGPLPKRRFMVTFDDGLREFAEEAVPILRRKGVPATIFVATDVLDNKDLLYRHKASLLAERLARAGASQRRAALDLLRKQGVAGRDPVRAVLAVEYPSRLLLDDLARLIEVDFEAYLQAERPYLTTREVKDLIAGDVTVGAHSCDHPPYRQISFDEQVSQTLLSVNMVRQRFGLDYGAFAFPFNDGGVSPKLFDIMFANGVDVAFGTSGFRDGPLPRRIQRIGFEGSALGARHQLGERYARKIILRTIGKAALSL